ncbi:MAG: hypothetical protein J1F35_05830 [Erysipelotrichales bacterium]|nr:hypothetical protein [Erysipelotrichales bacterium]
MQRDKIILGENIYIIDRYIPNDSIIKTSNEFVILRKFEFVDNLTFDTDVYVIDKDIWEMSRENKWKLAYPNTYSFANYDQTTNFSENIQDYNDSFRYNLNDLGYIYRNIDEEGNKILAKINCDLIRIYHPHNKVDQKYLIYVDSYINSIHFHLYCSPNSNLRTKSENEFIHSNNYYSEYVEFAIPNIEELFRNTFYDDSLNIIDGYEDTSFVPMKLFKSLYKIGSLKGDFMKEYLGDDYKTGDSSLFTNLIKVTLFPYSGIDPNTKKYMLEEDLLPNSCTFTNNVDFKLTAKFELSELPILACRFELPENSLYDNFKQAYEYYNDVSINEYRGIIYDPDENDDEYEAEMYGDVPGEEMHMCGYQIEISTDVNFNNVVYEKINWDLDFDDFSFQLNNIFERWTQYPEVLVCRARFIDRYLGNVIESNMVMITKEIFKYMINDTLESRVLLISKPLKYKIDIDEGVEKIIINNQLYFDSQEIECPYGFHIEWKAILKEGYETDDILQGDQDLFEDDYIISINTNKIQKFLKLIYNDYIIKYTVNDIDYFNSNERYIETNLKIDFNNLEDFGIETNNTNEIILTDNPIKNSLITIIGESNESDNNPKLYYEEDDVDNGWGLYFDKDNSITISAKTRYTIKEILFEGDNLEDNNIVFSTGNYKNKKWISNKPEGNKRFLITKTSSGPAPIIKSMEMICVYEQKELKEKIEFDYGDKVNWDVEIIKGYLCIDENKEFIIKENTKLNPTIVPDKIKVTFNCDKGIYSLYINEEEYIIKNNEISLYFDYGSEISWKANLRDGFEFESDSFGTIILNNPEGHVIDVISYPTKFIVDIVINKGISYIELNRLKYKENAVLSFDYGEIIKWKVVLSDKFYLINDEIKENEEYENIITEDLTISPMAKGEPRTLSFGLQNCKVEISINETKPIILEADSEKITETFEISYGDHVSWKGIPNEGYKFIDYSKKSDDFVITDNKNIEIDTERIQIPIRIRFNYGISKIIVNKKEYFKNDLIYVDYGDSISWTVECIESYKCEINKGYIEKIVEELIISPIPEIKKVLFKIQYRNGFDKLIINGEEIQILDNFEREYDYGTFISWKVILLKNYRLYISDGYTNALDGYVRLIEPKTEISIMTELILIPYKVYTEPGIYSIKISMNSGNFVVDQPIYEDTCIYGNNILWEIVLENEDKYECKEKSGIIEVINIDSFEIKPIINIKKKTLGIIIDKSISEISVEDGNEIKNYYTTKYLKYDYDTPIKWTAKLSEGYRNISDLSGEFLLTEDTNISPETDVISCLLFIHWDSGIEYIICNGQKIDTNATTFSFKYGDYVNMQIFLEEGYELSDINQNYQFKITKSVTDLYLETNKIEVPIKVIVKNGIDKILIYDNDELLETIVFTGYLKENVIYGTTLRYRIFTMEGYYMDNYEKTILVDNPKEVIISPIPERQTFIIRLNLDEGIDYVILNNNKYYSSQTLTFKYGDVLSWEVFEKSGYQLTCLKNQALSLIGINNEISINISSEEIGISVEIILNEGVESIFINDVSFTENSLYDSYYNEKINWSALPLPNYNIENNFGTLKIDNINQAYQIAPVAKLKQIKLELVFGNGIINYEINGEVYDFPQIIYFDYGINIKWKANIGTAYVFDGDGQGEFILTNSTVLEAKTNIRK